MSTVGTFPFGWVRGVRGDNWQLIWDPNSTILIAKSVNSQQRVQLAKLQDWQDAKAFADKVMEDPSEFL